jgi:predicted metalloprotease
MQHCRYSLKNETSLPLLKITGVIVVGKDTIERKKEIKMYLPLAGSGKNKIFKTMELQAWFFNGCFIEYEWLTGKTIIDQDDIEQTVVPMQQTGIDLKMNLPLMKKKAGR